MNIDYSSIGARIKYIRTQKGLSQEELAEFADVSPVYISNIERGEKSASLKTVIAVANAMNISTDSILMDNLTAKRVLYLIFFAIAQKKNMTLLSNARRL